MIHRVIRPTLSNADNIGLPVKIGSKGERARGTRGRDLRSFATARAGVRRCDGSGRLNTRTPSRSSSETLGWTTGQS